MLRGFEQMLMDVAINPEFVCALMEKLLELHLKGTGQYLDAVGKYLDVYRTSDDLATQNGLLMSPGAYRQLIKPYFKKYVEFVRSKTDAKIFYHSCGNVADLIDDLVQAGVEILNPVQVSALGDTRALKSRFGDKVSFWGGIDTQRVLPDGTPEEVEAEVKRRIHDMAPGGGYVVAAVHNIQPDVPTRNIVAMARAVEKYGVYPLAV